MTTTPAINPPILVIAILGTAIGLFYHFQLWQFGPDRLSLVSHTTPFWDFNNLWIGGFFARNDHVNWLFEVEAYRQNMREMLGANIPNQEWSYPPSMLLLGAALSLLPIFPAYILWTGGTLLLLHLALRQYNLSALAHWAILLSPAIFINALFGQNGALMAALLLAGLFNMQARPIFAGLCFGLMTIKPQYGLLLPFLLIANENWRTFATATTTGILLVLLTSALFGFDVWNSFFSVTRPMMTAIMQAPFPQPYHTNAIPVFVFARAIGAGLTLAYAIQALASLFAVIGVVWLWRKNAHIATHPRIALTLVLVVFATPYAYTYDMVIVSAALVLFFNKPPSALTILALAPIWLFPLYSHILVALFHVNLGAIAIAGAITVLWINLRKIDPLSRSI